MNTNKINTFFEQKILMNERRENAINKKYEELKSFAIDTDYIKTGEAQGSYLTNTYLKPIKENDLYDLDFVLLVEEHINVQDTGRITKYREKIQEDIEVFGKAKGWPEFTINECKYGFEVEFKSDLKIDIIPLFSNGEETFIINYFDAMTPKFDNPLLLTELLVRSNDENKTMLIKVIKFLKRAAFTDVVNLSILDSIAISILVIKDTNNLDFSWKNVAKLAHDIIKTKNVQLFNPFNNNEEFFGLKGSWAENAKKFLIVLDSIRLTIEKAVKEENDQIIVDMLTEGIMVPSNGIDEKPAGAGGHA